MKRREFLRNTGIAASIPILVNGLQVSAKATPIFEDLASMAEAEDRILVLVQLIGGNDGLNTIIPVDQYGVLSSLRESVFIQENQLLDFHDNLKMHPAMGGLQKLWEQGKFGTVMNVAYPDQNLSHFRSTDIWTSGSDSNQFEPTGWLGRYLASKHPDYPNNYPNQDNPDPLSLTIGALVSQTCQGPVYTMGLATRDIDNIYKLDGDNAESLPDGYSIGELEFIENVKKQTTDYMDVIDAAAQKGAINNSLWEGQDNNPLANQLKVVSRLINGGLKTKIYVTSIGNFDTHSNQIDQSGNQYGMHAQLLQNLSDAIYSFQEQMKDYGVEDKVLGMTFSEFGRRIMSNNSNGTDHGEAAPQFFFGSAVNPVVLGQYTTLTSDVQQNDNLPMEYDFRRLYTSVLKDWFKVPNNQVSEIMFRNYETVPILKSSTTSVEQAQFQAGTFRAYPNPASSNSTLEFYTVTSKVKIEVYNLSGIRVQTLLDKQMPEGNYEIKMNNLSNYVNGTYLIVLTNKQGRKTLNFSVIN